MTAADPFLELLNGAVKRAVVMPRVRFEVGLGEQAENWLRKKHANGAVHEPATIAAFLAASRTRDYRHIWDVGALWGYFSLLCCGLFENAEITAFEMHPGAIGPLERNVHPFARCVHAVVSDRSEKEVAFWINGFNIYEQPEGGWEKIVDEPGATRERGKDNAGRGFGCCDFITIDEYAAATTPPDLIKIDVEGYQEKAVIGGMETFRRHRPFVIIELHDWTEPKMARLGVTNRATVQPLLDLGYRGYWCGDLRSADATFERVEEMADRHERLSLMVLVP